MRLLAEVADPATLHALWLILATAHTTGPVPRAAFANSVQIPRRRLQRSARFSEECESLDASEP